MTEQGDNSPVQVFAITDVDSAFVALDGGATLLLDTDSSHAIGLEITPQALAKLETMLAAAREEMLKRLRLQ